MSIALLDHRRELLGMLEGWSARQKNIIEQLSCHAGTSQGRQSSDYTCDRSSGKPTTRGQSAVTNPICSFALGSRESYGSAGTYGSDGTHKTRRTTEFLQGPRLQHAISALGIDVHKARTLNIQRRFEHLNSQVEHVVSSLHAVLGCRIFQGLAHFEASAAFQVLSGTVILANAVVLAMSAEYYAGDGRPVAAVEPINTYNTLRQLEMCFLAFYLLELVVRCFTYRLRFFYGADWRWNWFDVVLLAFAVPEQLLFSDIVTGSQVSNISFFRMTRLLRLLKLLRAIRFIQAFREFRVILDSVLGCVQVLIWALALVFGISFMFAIYFVQGATEVRQRAAELCADDCTEKETAMADVARMYWGSVGSAMATLFMSATGGVDWITVIEPLWVSGVQYYVTFVFYITFFCFIIMNTMTSLFVDAARIRSEGDEIQVFHDKLRTKVIYTDKIVSFYRSIDKGGEGNVTFSDLADNLTDPRVVDFADCLEIDVTQLESFFDILSGNGRHSVDLSSFVVGCLRLRGAAKSVDVMELQISHRRGEVERRRLTRISEEQVSALHHLGGFCEEQFALLHQIMEAKRAHSGQLRTTAGFSTPERGSTETELLCESDLLCETRSRDGAAPDSSQMVIDPKDPAAVAGIVAAVGVFSI